MRSLLGLFLCLVLLLPVCMAPEKKTTQTVVARIFSIPDEKQTPDIVPPEICPNQSSYTIRTRIVVEGQPVLVPQKDGDPKKLMWWARTNEQIVNDLEDTKQVYKGIGLDFHVIEFIYREYNPGVGFHFAEARTRLDTLTIIYMLPNAFPFDGYSVVPWNPGEFGMVAGYTSVRYTLAHEIGHYFGLLHVFSDDYVDDTPDQKVRFCRGAKDSTENCGNVMGYCEHGANQVTKGQLDRFVRFLRDKRLNHITRNTTDILLHGKSMPKLDIPSFLPFDLLKVSNKCPLTN